MIFSIGMLCGLWRGVLFFFFFSSRRRHTRLVSDWSSDVCSSDLQEAGQTMPEQIVETIARVERRQHAGMAHDTEQPERSDCHEPERHDRAEQPADARSTLGLQAEQRDEN